MIRLSRESVTVMLATCSVSCTMSFAARAEESAPATTPLPPLRELAPGVYEIGKMRLDKNRNTLSFPGTVRLDKGFLEYVLVAPFGSAHESLLVTAVQPSDLHFAMLLLGAKGAGILTPGPEDKPPGQIDAEYLKRAPRLQGDPITIEVKWRAADDNEKTARAEDWIFNTATNKPAAKGTWIYTGSMFSEGKFMAQIEGAFVALVTNPSALINNPRPGNDDDQIWIVNEKTVPPAETPVAITLHLEGGEKQKAATATPK
jgi:hypothetical protein